MPESSVNARTAPSSPALLGRPYREESVDACLSGLLRLSPFWSAGAPSADVSAARWSVGPYLHANSELMLQTPELTRSACVDESVSAYRRSGRRAGFEQLMIRIRELADTAMIVWHLDRFTRQPAQLEELLLLAETQDIRIESVHGGTLDLSTQEGRLLARFLVGFAHYESAHKSTRVRRAHQERARQGLWHGRAAYGYTADGQLNPQEAVVVRQIATDYLAGSSEQEIARRLNAREIPTPGRSTRWHASTIQSILRSHRLHRYRVVRVSGHADCP